MITRELENGELLLIQQTEHSRLAGQFAAHWGNAEFARLDPAESVVRAATYHDFGWLTYETAPTINLETGRVYRFGQAPQEPRRQSDQQWCIDWLKTIDPYAALLVSKHRTGLAQGRYGTIAHPKSYAAGSLNPNSREFVDRNEVWQRTEAANLAAHIASTIETNYRLLQGWDLLSLYFSCQEPFEEYIEPLPTSYSDPAGVRITLTPRGDRMVAVDPYPFNVRPMKVQLVVQRVGRQEFEDLDDFRQAYFQAQREIAEFELI